MVLSELYAVLQVSKDALLHYVKCFSGVSLNDKRTCMTCYHTAL